MANELHNLKPAVGATQKRKRIGRGPGSGHGKTAGKGHKGQKSRSGYSRRYGFEGGQMPFVRQIPKRGFTNIFRVGYQVVNLRDLERVFSDGDTVTPELLTEKGLIRGDKKPIKVLASGELSKKLTVRANAFSKNAQASIEAAGGSCETVTT